MYIYLYCFIYLSSEAVLVCFLICWTPYHVQRNMFVFVTKTEAWNRNLVDVQDTLHLVAGE